MKTIQKIYRLRNNTRDNRGRLADTFNWDNAKVVFDKEERRGTKKKKA